MRIYDLIDVANRVFAFEVDNTFPGRRGPRRVVARIPGVHIVRAPNGTGANEEEEFCEFELAGEVFVIEEPFGDSSRYWIGAKPPRWVPQIAVVRDAFSRAGPFGWFMRG